MFRLICQWPVIPVDAAAQSHAHLYVVGNPVCGILLQEVLVLMLRPLLNSVRYGHASLCANMIAQLSLLVWSPYWFKSSTLQRLFFVGGCLECYALRCVLSTRPTIFSRSSTCQMPLSHHDVQLLSIHGFHEKWMPSDYSQYLIDCFLIPMCCVAEDMLLLWSIHCWWHLWCLAVLWGRGVVHQSGAWGIYLQCGEARQTCLALATME